MDFKKEWIGYFKKDYNIKSHNNGIDNKYDSNFIIQSKVVNIYIEKNKNKIFHNLQQNHVEHFNISSNKIKPHLNLISPTKKCLLFSYFDDCIKKINYSKKINFQKSKSMSYLDNKRHSLNNKNLEGNILKEKISFETIFNEIVVKKSKSTIINENQGYSKFIDNDDFKRKNNKPRKNFNKKNDINIDLNSGINNQIKKKLINIEKFVKSFKNN
jgi:hypothetical protein